MQSDPISLPDSHTQGEWMEDLRKQGKTIEDVAREQQERGYESGGTVAPRQLPPSSQRRWWRQSAAKIATKNTKSPELGSSGLFVWMGGVQQSDLSRHSEVVPMFGPRNGENKVHRDGCGWF